MVSQRVVLTGFGGPEVLKVVSREALPNPKAGEVLVRVHYAGVAFADVMQRYGQYPGAPRTPYTPGWDVVGSVVLAGAKTRLQPGDRVAALTRFGGYAQHAIVKERLAVAVPPTLGSAEAACLGLNYVTAYQLIHREAKWRTGDAVLVHSAAGGVGTALLQLARLCGLRTLGTASSGKQDVVRGLGAIAIDYQTRDFVLEVLQMFPRGIAVVFDPIGPENWKRSRRVIEPGGYLVAFGGLGANNRHDEVFSRGTWSLLGAACLHKMISPRIHFDFYGISLRRSDEIQSDLRAVLELAAAGSIAPVVGDILPLNRVADAHRRLARGEVCGKILLDCGALE